MTSKHKVVKLLAIFIAIPMLIILLANLVTFLITGNTDIVRTVWGIMIAAWAISVLIYIELFEK